MTWDLTPEEEFDPLLLPPVAMQYPRPLPEARVPYLVGSPDVNHWYGGRDPYDGYESQGYAGPVQPHMPDQRTYFQDRLLYGRGRRPADFEAPYPVSFYPEVVGSYDEIFNRQPAASTQERLWPGSDVRFDFDFAPRRDPNVYPGQAGTVDLHGLGQDEQHAWYESPGGALALAAGVGLAAFLATRMFLKD